MADKDRSAYLFCLRNSLHGMSAVDNAQKVVMIICPQSPHHSAEHRTTTFGHTVVKQPSIELGQNVTLRPISGFEVTRQRRP